MHTKSTLVGDLIFISSEDAGSNVHRLVRNADDIEVLFAHDIEYDVTTFREAPVSGVNVFSFAACEGVSGQPFESLVQGRELASGHRLILTLIRFSDIKAA